jgi:hypothetical protein
MMSFLDDLKDKMRENEAVMNLAEKFPPLASFLGNQPSEGGQSNPDATGEFDQESMKKQMMEEQTTIADGEDLEEGKSLKNLSKNLSLFILPQLSLFYGWLLTQRKSSHKFNQSKK